MITEETSKDEIIRYARLLIQAGTWVSVMDDSGGYKAHTLERESIFKSLRGFKRETDYMDLRPIFDAALDSHRAWDEWTRDLSGFSEELRALNPSLKLEFRQCIYDLAYSVAIRYRERNFLSVLFVGLVVSLRNFFGAKTFYYELSEYLNISNAEKLALNDLAEMLQLQNRIIL